MRHSTVVEGKEIRNTTLTRDYVCAQCFKPLVEKTVHLRGQARPIYAVMCAASPAHCGVISKTSAGYLQKEAAVVMQALPQGAPVLRSLCLEDDEGFD